MELASGHTLVALEGEELKRQKEDWKGYTQGLVRLNPGRWLFPTDYQLFANKLYNFKFDPTDVLVQTWMKCGTTWMQEILWTMRQNPNLDHVDQGKPINIRVPFLDCDMFLGSTALPPLDSESSLMKEFARMSPGKDLAQGLFLQLAESQHPPRTIKTHLPLSLLSPDLLNTAKVVYVARHPKDVVVSFYYHGRLFKTMDYVGSFDNLVQYFLDDDLVYGPYWRHVRRPGKASKPQPSLCLPRTSRLISCSNEETERPGHKPDPATTRT
ncbi:sulfotransferase 1A3-like [Homarus americanus]|uniref:sulfotransferase 1A3-like n=1 Tax=Homarus americanus TaxID=6706 RepID=UPI001C44A2C2|nr:sulfotransferase 1A3-like [Homarus americanus]